jgi:hypothetical protein
MAAHTSASAQIVSESYELKAGWNAVHLRVAPSAGMTEVFAGTAVEVVTTWYPEKQKVASLQDLSAEPWKSPEWRTWQAAGKPGAFLNNLYALESGRGYLIKSRVATTITLTGVLSLDRLSWQAQSFNLTGLPADPAAPATFEGFFANSPAHLPLRVFRLNADRWQAVPVSAQIDPKTAYWIWCGAGSEYQGPLDVRLAGSPLLQSAENSFTLSLLGTSSAELPVSITAQGALPLAGLIKESFTSETWSNFGNSAVTFKAGAGSAREYSVKWAAGAAPAAGAATVLELRAAGARIAVPVSSSAPSTAPTTAP